MYLSMTQAAELLGVSRQRVHQMIQRGDFEQVERFGPMLMLSRDEVDAVKERREAVAKEMAKSGSTIIAAQRFVRDREGKAERKERSRLNRVYGRAERRRIERGETDEATLLAEIEARRYATR